MAYQPIFRAFTGFIMMYCNDEPLLGWLTCDGKTLGLDTGDYQGLKYKLLFEFVNYWGNQGKSWGSGQTITLPDLKGAFLRGKDDMGTQGAASRDSIRTVGTLQSQNVKAHIHKLGTVGDYLRSPDSTARRWSVEGATVTSNTGPVVPGNEAGDKFTPKNVYINYIIKY